MSNALWPAGVPSDPFVRGFAEKGPRNKVVTPMDVGPDKKRRRSTVRVPKIDFTIPMTRAEYATFEAFFNDTLKDGTLPFDFTHPRTQTIRTFGFREEDYDAAPAPGGAYWNVTMHLEIVA